MSDQSPSVQLPKGGVKCVSQQQAGSASLRSFCNGVIRELQSVDAEMWAAVFVERRMDLQRQYLRGLVLSTTHGADVFTNILACLDGAEWEEQGELGNNFRALIRQAGRATQNGALSNGGDV